MVVFNCFNYHCWLKLFPERLWSVSLLPSILPTVNSVRQTLVFLSWPCLLWSWSKWPSYSHASWGLSYFAEFKLILLLPFFTQLAFHFFPYLFILFKENFLLWFLYFAMGTFILTSSLLLPDFLEWTGAAHLYAVLSSQISMLSWAHRGSLIAVICLSTIFSENGFFPFISGNCRTFLYVKCIVKRDVAQC